jgi:hypothetical protein
MGLGLSAKRSIAVLPKKTEASKRDGPCTARFPFQGSTIVGDQCLGVKRKTQNVVDVFELRLSVVVLFKAIIWRWI